MIDLIIYALAPEPHSQLKGFIEKNDAAIDSKATVFGDFDDFIRLPQECAVLVVNNNLIINIYGDKITLPCDSYAKVVLV